MHLRVSLWPPWLVNRKARKVCLIYKSSPCHSVVRCGLRGKKRTKFNPAFLTTVTRHLQPIQAPHVLASFFANLHQTHFLFGSFIFIAFTLRLSLGVAVKSLR